MYDSTAYISTFTHISTQCYIIHSVNAPSVLPEYFCPWRLTTINLDKGTALSATWYQISS